MSLNKYLCQTVVLVALSAAGTIGISASDTVKLKLDCFAIVVGKNASADGSVIFAHNEDTGPSLVNYYKVPGLNHSPGEEIILRKGGRVPQADHTLAYLWINIPTSDVCDSYINELGVAIGSDGCPSREERPEIKDGGIVFSLRRLVAERAHSSREGVKIAGKLIDEYGYASSGRTYVIADANEAWLLAVVNGKHWIAQRVPDDKIAVIANCYTIQEVNLKDSANFLGSPDLVEYAIRRGWYDPSRDGDFHFAQVYASPGGLTHPGNTDRMWRAANLITGKSLDQKSEFPVVVEPRKKYTVQDIMSILRDHYEGTELDKSLHYTLGNPHQMNNATICSPGTQYSFIAHLRNWMPKEISPLIWIAPYRPDVQAYCPWYPSVSSVPEVYGLGDYQTALKQQFNPPANLYDRNNALAFWKFVSLVEKVDENYGKNIGPVQAVWQPIEAKAFKEQEKFEKRILNMYQQDPGKSIQLITDQTNRQAVKIYKKAQVLISKPIS